MTFRKDEFEEKTCKRCGETKPLSEYHKQAKSNDGHQLYCKPCNNGASRAWAKRNPDAVKVIHNRSYANNSVSRRETASRCRSAEKSREYRKNNRDKINKTQREHRALTRQKQNAYRLVNAATKSGDIVNPDQCEMCDSVSILAHHEDYSKPLEVNWLCAPCHGKVHRTHA